jgi:flavin reductase (DIM6/NTAB) family NADH-FMN oxidoreductase RutF
VDAPDSVLAYRKALGTFATGVVVVTAEDAAGPLGLTVNSFTSVSLSPPLVLWCLDDASDRRHVYAGADRFVINVLAAQDRAHSDRFAWGACRLEPADLARSETGAPCLAGALTTFECETRQRIQVGDHLVIVGKVTAWRTGEGDGLVYFRGRYCRPVPEEE